MATHILPDHAVHYRWSDAIRPAITVASGDQIVLRTRDSSDNVMAKATRYPSNYVFKGHPMAGPIGVAGAEVGSYVRIELLKMRTSPYGYTVVRPGLGLLGDDIDEPYLHHWTIRGRMAYFSPGISVPLRPFLGIVGLAPRHAATTIPPHAGGGNLDFRDLTVGSSLYLPVQRQLGYLSVGDAHQSQADGEACGTAIETSSEARIRVSTTDAPPGITYVRSRPPVSSDAVWGSLGIDESFPAAARKALGSVIATLRGLLNLDFAGAYVLAGNAFDLRVVEAVNGGVTVVAAELRDGVIGIPDPVQRD